MHANLRRLIVAVTLFFAFVIILESLYERSRLDVERKWMLQSWSLLTAHSYQQKSNKIVIYEPPTVTDDFEKVDLKYDLGTAVLYHHGKTDMVSGALIKMNTWEAPIVHNMENVFTKDPTIQLIDIGCNIGVFTVIAAKRGRRVVAVDANINNLMRVRKSLLDNNVADRVKLVYNGISDRYSQFSMNVPKENIGHGMLAKPKYGDPNVVKSILMDDLLQVINFNRAILKIDIEGHEYEAFHHADRLFTVMDIPLVMMEWGWFRDHKQPHVPEFVIAFFTRFQYKAYGTLTDVVPLGKNYTTWPWDILWRKGDNVLFSD